MANHLSSHARYQQWSYLREGGSFAEKSSGAIRMFPTVQDRTAYDNAVMLEISVQSALMLW